MRTRTVQSAGVDLHVVDDGPADGPVVVLAHGFPELAYSWRHQIPALAAAGYRVVAPDQRGYGRSGRPEAVEEFDIFHLTGDLLALLDDLVATEAVFVGHDWGAIVVWQLALMAPQRVRAVVGMSVPFTPRAPAPPVGIMRRRFGDDFYMVHFQEPGVADEELGRDPAATMRTLLVGDDADDLPGWLGQDELDHYVAEFSRTGFTGGINWYRNLDRNWELTSTSPAPGSRCRRCSSAAGTTPSSPSGPPTPRTSGSSTTADRSSSTAPATGCSRKPPPR